MKDQKRYKKIVEHVEAGGVSRLAAQGTINSADYLAGAMRALEIALGWHVSQMPASWTLGLMFGKRDPIWVLWEEQQLAKQQAQSSAESAE